MTALFDRHPAGLYSLCLVEVAERFSFHVMRGIIVLYMIKVFLFKDSFAYVIFASFTALLYLTPLMGGYLADKYFSKRQTVLLGALTLSLGYFLLYKANNINLYFSLAIIATGNGLFMPNIANCVGEIYKNNDAKREASFSIFYSALNIGAFLPPFITTWIILLYGWQSAFLVSSIMMLLVSLYLIYICRDDVIEKKINYLKLPYTIAFIILFSFILSMIIEYQNLACTFIYLVGVLLVSFVIKRGISLNSFERNRLWLCLFLTFFSILFWGMAEQSAMSLAVFTEHNTNRQYFNITVSTLYFFSLNPFFIILLGPLFSRLWIWLDMKDLNPSIPSKFAIGTILMGLGFVILPLAIYFQNNNGLINPIWLIISYFLQASGELVFSPIGLSMIVELSPKNMGGLMMGLWYFATAISYLFAGYASQLTTSHLPDNQPLLTSLLYSHTFGFLGWLTIAAGVLILFIVPYLNKLMIPTPNAA